MTEEDVDWDEVDDPDEVRTETEAVVLLADRVREEHTHLPEEAELSGVSVVPSEEMRLYDKPGVRVEFEYEAVYDKCRVCGTEIERDPKHSEIGQRLCEEHYKQFSVSKTECCDEYVTSKGCFGPVICSGCGKEKPDTKPTKSIEELKEEYEAGEEQ